MSYNPEKGLVTIIGSKDIPDYITIDDEDGNNNKVEKRSLPFCLVCLREIESQDDRTNLCNRSNGEYIGAICEDHGIPMGNYKSKGFYRKDFAIDYSKLKV